ncbi:hypothetical protein COU57_03525 [Candidatus Pacearchaeota archaeon CG10_big_fil_rev_8_21_14_0_10_32_14]|nr:MAG: hypothetical protein COU57_03525 [Candidatus Pacearchaeota archaeon CG10_big_fil_rev_8_21_14_0_10_32_14]
MTLGDVAGNISIIILSSLFLAVIIGGGFSIIIIFVVIVYSEIVKFFIRDRELGKYQKAVQLIEKQLPELNRLSEKFYEQTKYNEWRFWIETINSKFKSQVMKFYMEASAYVPLPGGFDDLRQNLTTLWCYMREFNDTLEWGRNIGQSGTTKWNRKDIGSLSEEDVEMFTQIIDEILEASKEACRFSIEISKANRVLIPHPHPRWG